MNDYRWITGSVGIEVEYPIGEFQAHLGLNADVRYVGYTHATYRDPVIKHDGSCGVTYDGDHTDGCELVSPPTHLSQLQPFGRLAERLSESINFTEYFDDSEYTREAEPFDYRLCGVHVHVGMAIDHGELSSSINRRRLDRLWHSYIARRAAILEFVGDDRDPLKSQHAARYCGDYMAMSDKYGQLNLSPIMSGRQQTIEFRQMGHTSLRHGAHYLHSWADIYEWALFVALLTEQATRPAGWLLDERQYWTDSPDKRPVDGQPWSNFWLRPKGQLTTALNW